MRWPVPVALDQQQRVVGSRAHDRDQRVVGVLVRRCGSTARERLDVAAAGHEHRDVLRREARPCARSERVGHLDAVVDDHRTPRRGVQALDLRKLVGEQPVEHLGVGQDRLELRDALEQFGVLGAQRLVLERGQPAQLHVQHRLGLDLAQAELLDQALLGGRRRLGAADQRDHLVEPVDRESSPSITCARARARASRWLVRRVSTIRW
jgi:hypothetical protein